MSRNRRKHLYGPVFSRRLGRSLGIDLVPFKTCSYDCIYCQLGRTTNKTVARREYVPIDEVLAELEPKLADDPAPDFIGLAGSGEPTLHSRIGELIRAVKRMTTIPVAVLTNGSLLWMPEVQRDLERADLVLPSLDAGDQKAFELVNRPHEEISFERMAEGLVDFARQFHGSIWLEVFLLSKITDLPDEVAKIASLAGSINPDLVQLNTVSRPPSEDRALAVPVDLLEQLAGLFPGTVEVIGESGRREPLVFPPTRRADDDILDLLSRRPCTVAGIASGLGLHPGEVVKILDRLQKKGLVQSHRRKEAIFFERVRVP